jgi:hypothetical protein
MSGAVTQAAIERARPYAAELIKRAKGNFGLQQAILAGDKDDNEFALAFAKAIADEREQCAKLADTEAAEYRHEAQSAEWREDRVEQALLIGKAVVCETLATAIRASGGEGGRS